VPTLRIKIGDLHTGELARLSNGLSASNLSLVPINSSIQSPTWSGVSRAAEQRARSFHGSRTGC